MRTLKVPVSESWVFLEFWIWEFPNPHTWNSRRDSLVVSVPVGFLCLHFKVSLESTPQICRAEWHAWSRSSTSSRVRETIRLVPGGEAVGCWEGRGVGRKQAEGKEQVLLCGGASRTDREGGGGTGQDRMGCAGGSSGVTIPRPLAFPLGKTDRGPSTKAHTPSFSFPRRQHGRGLHRRHGSVFTS